MDGSGEPIGRMDGEAVERSVKVLHVITGLEVGGAEIMLWRLLSASDRERFPASVLSLMPPGPIAAPIAAMGIGVYGLGMARRLPGPASIGRLLQVSRRLAPDLIQGWMYHGNLAGTFAWWRQRRRPSLVWSIHHSLTGLADEKPLTRRLIVLGARLSRLPQAIVYCSRESARQHEALGFDPARRVILPNGIDTDLFRPDPEAGARLRALVGAPAGTPLIGMAARAHPMKDHANLIRAAARLVQDGIELRLVLFGRGVDAANPDLAAEVRAAGLGTRVSLMRQRDDLPRLVPGLDLMVSPSAWGEAFPLAIGEAMASGVPCLVTDIGDCAWLVGDAGEVVPPRDTEALAAALRRYLALPQEARRALGERARARVVENFALPAITRRYEDLYAGLAARRDAVPPVLATPKTR